MEAILIDPGETWEERTTIKRLPETDQFLSVVTETEIDPGSLIDVYLGPTGDIDQAPGEGERVLFEAMICDAIPIDDDRQVVTITGAAEVCDAY